MHAKTFNFLLFSLGLIFPGLLAVCPHYDRLPTTCDCQDEFDGDNKIVVELFCTSASMDELKDALGVMDKSSPLQVALDDMVLGTLPSRIFDGLNVFKLDISHCELDSLAPHGEVALAGLEDKLEVLSIASSFTEDPHPTKLQLGHLNRLKELDLSYDAVTELGDDWFANGPTSLTSLLLSNNGIEKIGDRAFANLVNLENLELHGNRFGPLKRSMFPSSADKLEKIELDNNDLTSVPDDLFSNMPALKELSVRTNRISSLQERAFKPIWSQLDVLDARGNPLECDSSMEWMFNAKTNAAILGTCESSLGGGKDLRDFIRNRG